jgi:uncharacterized protein YecE (DUF72 family)
MGDILVGTSGFSFNDWIGEVYPAGIKKHEMLPYYEQALGFKALEVNFTYYALPSRRTMESFMNRTSPGFVYAVKAYKGITHERGEDLARQIRLFKDGVSPLGSSMKTLLFQFPYSFVPNRENLDYLGYLRHAFSGTEATVEFRNAKWMHEKYTDALRALSLGYCVVDEPKLRGLVPFYPILTSSVGYFRFHGRNENWFGTSVDVRYDYLYTRDELEELVKPIKETARSAALTLVFFNNCHAGKAAKNAQMFMAMLKGG